MKDTMKGLLTFAFFVAISSAHAQMDFNRHEMNSIKEIQEHGEELLQKAEDGDKSAQNLMAMAAAFMAKETCSCRFISQLPAEICKENMPKLPINIVPKVDLEKKTVSASIMVYTQTAKVKAPNLGCVLNRKP